MRKAADAQLAYALLRFGFGINMAVHGVNRLLGGLARFAAKTSADFADTLLPRFAVWPFAFVTPLLEFVVGVLLIAGAYTRTALLLGSLLMAALMFGTALRGEWNVLGTQLVYLLVYYLLLARRGDDVWGIDAARRRAVE